MNKKIMLCVFVVTGVIGATLYLTRTAAENHDEDPVVELEEDLSDSDYTSEDDSF